MRSILERYKKLVFKAKIRRYIKIFQEFSTQKTGFLSVPKQVRIAPVRLKRRENMIAVMSQDVSNQFYHATGIKSYPLKPYPHLDAPVASHADMLICKIDKTVFCYNDYYLDNEEVFSKIKEEGYEIRFTTKKCNKVYPNDIGLNALVIGKRIFCKKEHIAPEIIEYAKENSYQIIDLNQGYSACSTLVLNEKTAITGDYGVQKVLLENDIRAELIDTSNIILKGYNSGFIGGATGVHENKIYLFGNEEYFTENQNIMSIITEQNFDIIPILHDQVYDFGGIKLF